MGILRKSYLLIFIILIGTIVIYFKTSNSELQSFTLNLITEILGIFITVFLIDYVIRERQRKEKIKILKTAFFQFKRPVHEILHLFVIIYKATCETKPENLTKSYQNTFSSAHFYERIKYLDFMKEAPITPSRNWTTLISQNINSLKNSFDKIIDKYGFVLDSTIISEIDEISNSPFLQILSSGEIILHSDVSSNYHRKSLNILAMDSLDIKLKIFLEKIYHLNSYFGTQVNEDYNLNYDIGIWLENIAPKLGTGIVDLN